MFKKVTEQSQFAKQEIKSFNYLLYPRHLQSVCVCFGFSSHPVFPAPSVVLENEQKLSSAVLEQQNTAGVLMARCKSI